MLTVDRDFIINETRCPVCGARERQPCFHQGKGSLKKMHKRVSHHERMQAAQKIAKAIQEDEEALIEP